MKIKKRNRKNFTLLEVMVAICLIATAAGAVTWKGAALLKKRQFEMDLGRFQAALLHGRMMALNTRSDWELELVVEKGRWVAYLVSREEGSGALFVPQRLSIGQFELFLNKKSLSYGKFIFYSTGVVEPSGMICLNSKHGKCEWDLNSFFRCDKSVSNNFYTSSKL